MTNIDKAKFPFRKTNETFHAVKSLLFLESPSERMDAVAALFSQSRRLLFDESSVGTYTLDVVTSLNSFANEPFIKSTKNGPQLCKNNRKKGMI